MVVAIGACVPVLFGKETVSQLEMVTEAVAEPGTGVAEAARAA